MTNLFQTLDKIYTSGNVDFVQEIDVDISPVVLNLMLSRYYRNSHHVKYLNKYVYVLDVKEFSALAWAMIQPKLTQTPYVEKVIVVEDSSRYDFLLEKVKARFEIGNNDWKFCKDAFLEHIKQNLKEYLIFYGCKRKEWSDLGLDFEDSKRVQTTEIIEGLGKWS